MGDVYGGLGGRVDPALLHPMMAPSEPLGVDYLIMDDFSGSHDDVAWGERMNLAVGTSFVGGSCLGAALGARVGLVQSTGAPWRLRVNNLLNVAGKRGGRLGRGLASAACLYYCAEKTASLIREKEDMKNTLIASTASILLWNSAGGAKKAIFPTMVLGGAAWGLVKGARYLSQHPRHRDVPVVKDGLRTLKRFFVF